MKINRRTSESQHKLSALERQLAMYIVLTSSVGCAMLLDKWLTKNAISRRTMFRDCHFLEYSGLISAISISGTILQEITCAFDDDYYETPLSLPLTSLPPQAQSDVHVIKIRRIALLIDFLNTPNNPNYKKWFIAHNKDAFYAEANYYSEIEESMPNYSFDIDLSEEELDAYQAGKPHMTAQSFLNYIATKPENHLLSTSLRTIQREMQTAYKVIDWVYKY